MKPFMTASLLAATALAVASAPTDASLGGRCYGEQPELGDAHVTLGEDTAQGVEDIARCAAGSVVYIVKCPSAKE